MKIEIQIDLGLSTRQKRIVRAGVVASVVVAALGVGIAVAAPIDTTWVVDKQQLSATSLKKNLDGLQAQIAAGSMGTWCGMTPVAESPQAISAAGIAAGSTGYFQAAEECTAACGAAAHMCSQQEIVRSLSLPTPPTIPPGPGLITGSNGDDCLISYAAAGQPYFDHQGTGGFTRDVCTIAHKIHCCN